MCIIILFCPSEAKPQLAHKNGKKAEVGGGTSFFTWFMVLALLGVWTSVAVVYFDLVDYQGVIGESLCSLFCRYCVYLDCNTTCMLCVIFFCISGLNLHAAKAKDFRYNLSEVLQGMASEPVIYHQ